MKQARSLWVLVMLVALAYSSSRVRIIAQQGQPKSEDLEVIQLHPNFYMIARAGGNIAVQIGREGVVLVDAGLAERADAVIAAIQKVTDQPIRYIINTSADADHVGGSAKIAQAGQSLFAGNRPDLGGGRRNANGGGAAIAATQDVFDRMSAPIGRQSPYPVVAWPTETFTRKQKNIYLNEEAIEIMRAPAAHTDGDSIVLFRRSDVVVTGDVVDTNHFPDIELAKGGSIAGEIAALNRLIELVVPSIPLPWKDGGTLVIPGHGRICEQADIVEYRDMVTIVRDRVLNLKKKGLTLDQVKAANPTQGFRSRYGTDSGPRTTDTFVEAIYRSLAAESGTANP